MGAGQGETVPYIICVTRDEQGQATPDSASLPLAQRAYHIEELQGNAGLAVDVQYYLAQQVILNNSWGFSASCCYQLCKCCSGCVIGKLWSGARSLMHMVALCLLA